MKKIITLPGEVIDFETVFMENEALAEEPVKKGRFERVEYTTDVYEDGKTYSKYCNVYLPWCYDAEKDSRRFNIMYYQHGNTLDPDFFTDPERKKTLDRLFEQEGIDPCILVFTTYYFDCVTDADVRADTGYVPAGDGNYLGVKANYWKEVVGDILPAVESRYSVYAEGTSPNELKAARDHRGFSGYSRGGVCTWYIIHNAFDYFRWYSPMSCHTTAGKYIQEPVTEAEAVAYITAPIKARPDLPFFIYAAAGDATDAQLMKKQLKVLTKEPEFSFGTDGKTDNIYLTVSGFPHHDKYAPYYYYNALQVLFKGI